MTVSRGDAVEFLNEQFSAMATAVGQDSNTDTGYKPDVDNALRVLGKAESELATATVADSLRDAYFAIAEYFAARRLWRQLNSLPDHTMGETTVKYGDLRKNAKDMMVDAAKRAAMLGYIVDGSAKIPIFQVY